MYRNLQEYIDSSTASLIREGLPREHLRRMYWDQKLSVPEIARLSGFHPITIYEWMRKFEIPRRDYRETSYLYYSKIKPQFQPRSRLGLADEKLKIAGVMLYWAEGAKTGHTVDFSNCDPVMIRVFLQFLRRICGVGESRLRVLLYFYEGQDAGKIIRYWIRVTGIPRSQFLKPYVSKLRVDRSRQRVMEYGVAHIRYNDTRLLQQIFAWIQQEANTLLGRYPSGQRGLTVNQVDSVLQRFEPSPAHHLF